MDSAPLQFELSATCGHEQIARFQVAPGSYTVGRASACDLVVVADGVSRRHARIICEPGGSISVEDLGSTSGTFLDGAGVRERTAMRSGQYLQIGTVLLRVDLAKLPSNGVGSPDGDVDAAEERFSAQRYEVGKEIAKGGMGAVLAARQMAAGRTVAMKVMVPDLQRSPSHRARFLEEAQITSQLEHPNIVPVHDVGVDEDGRLYYTMKLIQGTTLRDILNGLQAAPASEACRHGLPALLTIFQKICDAIAFAHSKSVIHRDLKPGNVMVGQFGEVLVMDWGIAKLLKKSVTRSANGIDVAGLELSREPDQEMGQTLDGTVIGTPRYMAPEQARGEVDAIDRRTDVFALGAILYEILTLHAPLEGRTAGEALENARHGRVVPIRDRRAPRAEWAHLPNKELPESLAAVAMKALAVEPDRRYQNVEALQADITAYQNGFATTAESPSLWRQSLLLVRRHREKVLITAAALLLLVGVSVFFVLRLKGAKNLAEANEQRAESSERAARQSAQQALDQANLAQTAQREAEDARFKADEARAKAEAALISKVQAEGAARTANEGRAQADKAAMLAKDGQSAAQARAEVEERKATLAAQQAALATKVAEAAHAHELEVRKNSVVGVMRDGFTAAAAGDFSVAMLHFSAALQLQEDDPGGAELQRRRLAMFERYSPHLVAEWPVSNGWLAAFAPDGTRLVTAGSGKVAAYLAVGAGEKLTQAQIDVPAASLATWSPDGRWLVAGGKGQSGVYDGHGFGYVRRLVPTADYTCRDLLPLPNSAGVLVTVTNLKSQALGTNTATLYDFTGRALVSETIDHLGNLASIGFSDASHFIAVFRMTRSGSDGRAALGMQLAESLDHARGNHVFKNTAVPQMHGNFNAGGLDTAYIPVVVSSDAEWVVGTGVATPNQAALFDTKGGSILSLTKENEKHEQAVATFRSPVSGAVFSTSAKFIAVATMKSLYLWNAADWNVKANTVDRPPCIANVPVPLERMSFSKNGAWLAGVLPAADAPELLQSTSQEWDDTPRGAMGESIWLWSLDGSTDLGDDAEAALHLLRHAGNVGGYQFDPKGRLLVTLSRDTARLWLLDGCAPQRYTGDLGAYNLSEDFLHKQAPLDADFASKLRPLGRTEPVEFPTVGQRIAYNKDKTLAVRLRTGAIQVFAGTMPLSPVIACPGVVNAAFVDGDNTLLIETNTGVVKYLNLAPDSRPPADVAELAVLLSARVRTPDGKIIVADSAAIAACAQRLRTKYGDRFQLQAGAAQ